MLPRGAEPEAEWGFGELWAFVPGFSAAVPRWHTVLFACCRAVLLGTAVFGAAGGAGSLLAQQGGLIRAVSVSCFPEVPLPWRCGSEEKSETRPSKLLLF